MSTKQLLSRIAVALLISICIVWIFFTLRDDNALPAEEAAVIRDTYAGYALTFPADAPHQSLEALLEDTTFVEEQADRYVFKNYDTAAFAPYLPLAETISAAQTSPLDKSGNTLYIIYTTAEEEEFCQCYEKGELVNQIVYLPSEDRAYEITEKKVTVHENFRAESAGES